MQDRIKESDWKIYRRVHQAALLRYCDKVLSEIQYFAGERDKTSHERYLEIYKRIHERDETLAKLFNGLKRSDAVFKLAGMRYQNLVTDDEFAEFSQDLRDHVEVVLRVSRL
jgi:hypothetical protein